jgi:tetratricopeptide (TPR) repeat protein
VLAYREQNRTGLPAFANALPYFAGMGARISVLGEIMLQYGSEPTLPLGSGEQAQLLVILAERPGRSVETGELAEMVAAQNLDQQLSKLKAKLRTIGLDDALSYDVDTARLDLPCAFDIDDVIEELDDAVLDGDEDRAWKRLNDIRQGLRKPPYPRGRQSPEVIRLRQRADDLRFRTLRGLMMIGGPSPLKQRRVEALQHGFAAYAIHPVQIWSELVDELVRAQRFGDAVGVCESISDESTADQRQVRRRLEEIHRAERQAQGNEILQLPLPPLADAIHGWSLVGRDRELAVLGAEWESVKQGRFRSVVCTAEPGAGKSRIVYEVAHRYHADGANVLVSPVLVEDLPCRPVVAALHHVFEHASDQIFDGVESWVLQLLRPLVGLRGETPPDLKTIARMELYRALHDVIARIARERPLVLILEDLHRADDATAEFVTYLHDRQPPHVLLIGTWAGRNPPSPYREMQLSVARLDKGEHAELVQQVYGEVDEAFARGRYELTGGSPFLTVNEADLDRIDSWIRGLCDSMNPRAYELLRIAAVYGPTFDPVAVEELAAEHMQDVNEALEFARMVGLVAVRPTDATRYEFCHSLIRHALRDAMPVAERARLSAELVPIMRRRGEDVALIARRALFAGQLSFMPRPEAARAGIDAAVQASERGAHGVAVRYLEGALRLAQAADDAELICEAGYVLGVTRWRHGEVRAARADFVRAAAIANERGRHRWEVEIALAYGGPLGFKGVTTSSVHVALLERALDAAAGIDGDRDQIRIQAALAGAWTFDPEHRDRSRELAEYALSAAQRSESDQLVAEVLTAVCWAMWTPDDSAVRRNLAERFCTAADRSHLDHLQFESRLFRLAVKIADGDIDKARRDYRTCKEIGARSAHHAALLTTISGTFALMEGRIDAAEVAIKRALEDGRRDQNPVIFELFAAQILMLRRLQGRVDTLRAASEALTDEFPDLPAWKAGLGTIYADLNRLDDARRCLDALAKNGFGDIPRDLFFVVTLEHASRIAHRLGDQDRARQLYDLMLPLADQLVVAGGAAAVYGVVEHSLGLLAETLGDVNSSVAHLERAHARHAELGLRSATVYAAFDLARVLETRGWLEDTARALKLRDAHNDAADRLGMVLAPQPEAFQYAYAGPIIGRLGGAVERVEREALKVARARLQRQVRASTNPADRHWGRRVLPSVLPQLYRPAAACGWSGRIQVVVRSPDQPDDEDQLLFDIGEKATVTRSIETDVELTITLPLMPFLELLMGARNSVGVWADGTAEVEGDPTLAARLIEMFAGERPPTL